MTSDTQPPDPRDVEFATLVTEHLVAAGLDAAEIDQARASGYLSLLAMLRFTVADEARYTMAEAAGIARVPTAWAERFWRALGFADVAPDRAVLTDSDVEALATIAAFVQLGRCSIDGALQLTRLVASSMARIADAQVSAMTSLPGGPVTEELAALGADAGLQAQSRVLDYVWRRHLRDAALRVVSGGGRRRGAVRAVGFADLVGFTALSQQLEDDSLAGVVNRFEEVAFDEVTRRGGRVVKMIGDEVMFVNEDARAAVDTGLALAEAYAADEMLSDVRVGIAHGPVLTREGDVFGPSVNLASRLVKLALPGTVLVSEDARRQLDDDDRFVTRALRPRQVKDVGLVQPSVARRTGGQGPAPAPSHRHTTRLVRAPAPSGGARDATA